MSNKIDWEFIAKQEGKLYTTGYVPYPTHVKKGHTQAELQKAQKKNHSGVTIATGFDIGQNNLSDLNNLKLSAELIKKFTPYLGLKQQAAVDFLNKNPLVITIEQAKEVDLAYQKHMVPLLIKQYNTSVYNRGTVGADKKLVKIHFEDLPGQAQTVIASFDFQRGNLISRELLFWKAVTSQNWAEAVKVLRKSGTIPLSRRKQEADLLEQLVKFEPKVSSLMFAAGIWNAVLLICFIPLPANTFGQTKSVIFDAETKKSFQNYERTMTESSDAKGELQFVSGKNVKNCRDYLAEKAAITSGLQADKIPDSSVYIAADGSGGVFANYIICDFVKTIKDSEKSGGIFKKSEPSVNFGLELYNRLDVNSFPNQLKYDFSNSPQAFQNRFPQGFTPRNARLLKHSLKIKPFRYGLSGDDDEYSFSLDVLAETDLDGNGKNDLIVAVDDEALKASYRFYQLMVIYDFRDKGLLRAKFL